MAEVIAVPLRYHWYRITVGDGSQVPVATASCPPTCWGPSMAGVGVVVKDALTTLTDAV